LLSCALYPESRVSNNLTARKDFWTAVELFLEQGANPYFSLTVDYTNHYEASDPFLCAESGENSFVRSKIQWQWEVTHGSKILRLIATKGGRACIQDLAVYYSAPNASRIGELMGEALGRKAEKRNLTSSMSMPGITVNAEVSEGQALGCKAEVIDLVERNLTSSMPMPGITANAEVSEGQAIICEVEEGGKGSSILTSMTAVSSEACDVSQPPRSWKLRKFWRRSGS
jgi:hypothetical protein